MSGEKRDLAAVVNQVQEEQQATLEFRSRSFDLGRCYLTSLNKTSEVLSFAEGEGYK
jgi:hypothetical protein